MCISLALCVCVCVCVCVLLDSLLIRDLMQVLAHNRAPLTPVNEPANPKIGVKLPIAFPPAKDVSLGVFAVATAKPKL